MEYWTGIERHCFLHEGAVAEFTGLPPRKPNGAEVMLLREERCGKVLNLDDLRYKLLFGIGRGLVPREGPQWEVLRELWPANRVDRAASDARARRIWERRVPPRIKREVFKVNIIAEGLEWDFSPKLRATMALLVQALTERTTP